MHIDPAARCSMLEKIRTSSGHAFRSGSSSGRGPWLRLVSEVLNLAGPETQFIQHHERPWSSATFAGSRHTITLAFDEVSAIMDGETFIEALPDHEFTIAGQLVADAVIRAVTHEALPAPRMVVEAEFLVLEAA